MRTRLASILLASLALGGCPKSGGDAKPAARTCDDVTANGRILLTVMAEARTALGSPVGPSQVEQAALALGASCVDDGWSPDAVACMATADREKVRGCLQSLDPSVGARLDAEIERIFNGEEVGCTAPTEATEVWGTLINLGLFSKADSDEEMCLAIIDNGDGVEVPHRAADGVCADDSGYFELVDQCVYAARQPCGDAPGCASGDERVIVSLHAR